MVQRISATELKTMLDTGATGAFIDVREVGEYNNAHIPGTSLVPRHQLEFRMPRLVPYRATPLVVCDDDGRRAPLAAATLERMGYKDVRVLEGGINHWVTREFPTEWGLNVPSKDFGERMQVEHHIPELRPEELQTRMQRGERIVILDSRTPEEHRRSTIPGARSVPGGELSLRIADLVPDPNTPVVVHCAGRTRSIIGARLLQRMGLRNVYDLRNGTMGWRMAGLELETGSERLELPPPSKEGLAAAEAFATRLATEDGVEYLTIDALQALRESAKQENVYLIDVRTAEEYAAGHIPGFQWFPGGQAVQRTDDLVGVKNGLVAFACDGRVRATVAASWYRQMGFPNVYVVDGGTQAWLASGQALESGRTTKDAAGYDEGLQSGDLPFGYQEASVQVESLTPSALQERLNSPQPPVVVFTDTSGEFSSGHVPGAYWLSRSWLELQIAEVVPHQATPVVLVSADGQNAMLAGGTLKALGYQHVAVLTGGMRAWRQADLPVEKGLTGVTSMPHDVMVMGPERNWADAIEYLRWEEELGRKYETHLA